jgi:hypothetical protein
VNLDYRTSWGAEQFSSNVIMNPGFEPTIDRTIVIVKKRTATGFSDNEAWLGRSDGFWNGGSFQVLTGQSAGKSGRISSSRRSGPDELPWFTTKRRAPMMASGDAISITRKQKSGPPANWWIASNSKKYVSLNRIDHPPGSLGQAVAELELQGGEPTRMDSYLDSGAQLGGQNFEPVNGEWRLSFWARATVASGASVAASFQRLNGGSAFVAQTVALTGQWQQVAIDFNAKDSGAAAPLDLRFVASGPAGAAVRLDDVQLGLVSDLAGGAWRAQVVSKLSQLHPGYLRDWQGQLGDTAANRLAPILGRAPTRYNPDPADNQQNFFYSLPDFLSLCQQVGAQPWIVLPTTLYSAEYTALGQYLAQAQRSYNFSEVVVEWGNENWNAVFRGGGIENPVTMAQAANSGFALLRAAAGSVVPLHLVVNGQFANPWVGQQAISNAPQADAVDVAPYYFYTLNATDSQATALGNLFTMSDESSNLAQLQASTGPLDKSVDIYEVNASTYEGTAPEAQRDPYVAGMVSGTALADRLLTALYAGVNRQLVFDLAQYNFAVSPALGNVMLWGITNSLADSTSLRPTGLALEMLNRAIAGDFYPVTVPAGVSGINAAAFLSSAGWSLAIVSSNPGPTPLTLSLPAGATPPAQLLTLSAPTITSTNDVTANNPSGQQQVSIVNTPFSGTQLTIPPYGFVVLLPPNSPAP